MEAHRWGGSANTRADDNFIKEVAVTSITHQEHIVPEGGGFGWSTIDIILVKFSNSESQLMRLYNWYSSKEMISRNFTEELDYPVNNMDEALKMLFRALKGYVPDESYAIQVFSIPKRSEQRWGTQHRDIPHHIHLKLGE